MTEDIRTEELLFMAKKIGLDLTSQLEFYLGDQEMSGLYLLSGRTGRHQKEKILPTDKLRAEDEQLLRKADRMESELFSVLDQQEKALLWKLERKLLLHLTDMEHSQSNKDRRLSYSEKSYTAAGTV